jgi:hypothetical protein
MPNLKAVLAIVSLAIVVMLVVVTVSATPNSHSTPSQIAATTVAAAIPTTPVAPTFTPIPATTTPVPTLSPNQVAVGQEIPKVYNEVGEDIKVKRVADPPLISQEMALQILTKQLGGSPFNYGQPGNTVTLDATYGLVTEGKPSPSGWVGHRNIKLKDGEVLDHFEDRLMWVLDFTGVKIPLTDYTCYQIKTCTPGNVLNHAVYLIDAKAMQTTIGKNFYAP